MDFFALATSGKAAGDNKAFSTESAMNLVAMAASGKGGGDNNNLAIPPELAMNFLQWQPGEIIVKLSPPNQLRSCQKKKCLCR